MTLRASATTIAAATAAAAVAATAATGDLFLPLIPRRFYPSFFFVDTALDFSFWIPALDESPPALREGCRCRRLRKNFLRRL